MTKCRLPSLDRLLGSPWGRLAVLIGLMWTGAGVAATFTRDVSIDAGGRWAVTVSADGLAHLHDLESGGVQEIAAGRGVRWRCAALSADGARLALGGGQGVENRILVLERESGRTIAAWQREGAPAGMVFSPDGRVLAVGYRRPARIVLHGTADWRVKGSGHIGGLLARVAFGPDGSVLYALARGEQDRLVALSAATMGPLREMASVVLQGGPNDIAITADGRTIAIAFNARDQVELREPDELRLRETLPGEGAYDGRPGLVAWLPGEPRRLVTLLKRFGGLYLLRRWTFDGATPRHDDLRLDGLTMVLAGLPDGSVLLGGGEGRLQRLRW